MASATGPRGVKRKRSAVVQEDGLNLRLTGKLHHVAREVRKVAKKAKAFEMQKLVKKLKSLRAEDVAANGKSIASYEEQLEALKQLDNDLLANLALKNRVNKDRTLSQNDHIQAALSAEVSSNLLTPSATGSPSRIVEERLLSNKLLAAAIRSALTALKEILDPTVRSESNKIADETLSPAVLPLKLERSHSPLQITRKSHANAGDSEIASPDSEYSELEDVAAQGGHDDDGWESGSVIDVDYNPQRREANSDEDSWDEDDDAAPSAQRDPQVSEASRSLSEPSHSAKSNYKATAESTFLPSLAVGFTRGDSDASDIDDGDMKVGDGIRKNRRGQRARRAIWEKKYGRNANHVKMQREAAQDDSRRAKPSDRNKDRARGPGKSRPAQPSGARTPFNAPPSDKGWSHNSTDAAAPAGSDSKRKDDKPLHPSWEAKRRLKEKLKPVILPAQGKKITFS